MLSEYVENDSDAPDGRFQEVRLTKDSCTFLKDSILLVPGILTREECQLLVAASEVHATDLSLDHGELAPRQRLHIRDLGPNVEALSAELLRNRLLPFVEKELPHVAREVFGQSSELGDMSFHFASREPAVNRYTEGGEFPIHRDRKSFTINVLLSDPDAFAGGGTAFFPDLPSTINEATSDVSDTGIAPVMDFDAESSALGSVGAAAGSDDEVVYPAQAPKNDRAKLLLHPCQGTGVIFNGIVEHAGQPVTAGIRHVYVASFDLDTPVLRGGVWAWAPGKRGANLWGPVCDS